ncbi:MAG: Rubrerythrin [Chitinophagaceae bacterium]|nr:Rubrerythrin [Chitinophagaceae bacterium]
MEYPIAKGTKTNDSMITVETTQRSLVLQIIQPGLAGLMDGSVSSLAPLFATAYATHNTHTTFIVGLATAAGAGISMAFSEALSDDGRLSGRGNPWQRGLASGLMTFAGAIGHVLPFLFTNFSVAMMLTPIIVAVELLAISFIRYRYMQTPLGKTLLQVFVGGVIVFLAGMFIGKG